jgi:hypothetical protein
VLGVSEFGDTFEGRSQDFGVTYEGSGAIEQDFEPPPSTGSEFWWNTTGPISFALDPTTSIGGAASANGFVIAYALAAGQAAPLVRMTLADGSLFDVGPLVGGPFEGELIFAFTSSDPFTTVSLDLDSDAPLRTQFAAFFSVPASSVPEPTTFLLVAAGVLVSGRRLVRSGRK